MALHLTRHASNRARLYDMTMKEVTETVTHADEVTEAAYGARHAWKPTSSRRMAARDIRG